MMEARAVDRPRGWTGAAGLRAWRRGGGARPAALAIPVLVLLSAALPAPARGFEDRSVPGTLRCVIGAGVAPVLGSDRQLACTFSRAGAPTELYEGLTGIVTALRAGEQTVVFEVSMPRPKALAALAGDYEGRHLAAPGGTILAGGTDGEVTLTPVAGRAATDAAALNILLRLNQLHLNYAGRLPRARDRGTR